MNGSSWKSTGEFQLRVELTTTLVCRCRPKANAQSRMWYSSGDMRALRMKAGTYLDEPYRSITLVCAYRTLNLPQHVQWSPGFRHKFGIARQFWRQGA